MLQKDSKTNALRPDMFQPLDRDSRTSEKIERKRLTAWQDIRMRLYSNKLAMTGEVSIHGSVKPVGGVVAKVEAAFQSGADTVLIPKENWQAIFEGLEGVKVIPVDRMEDVFRHVFGDASAWTEEKQHPVELPMAADTFAAAPSGSVLHAGKLPSDARAQPAEGTTRSIER